MTDLEPPSGPALRRIAKRLDASTRLAAPLVARAAVLVLPFEARCRSRLRAALVGGEEVALFLPRGTVLRHGDLLVADDGGLVRVEAAPQDVLRVTAPSAQALARAAYHLGNRHTPVEVGDGFLKLEADPVLRDMLERLGMRVEAASQPFDPEAGAYGGGHRHGHDASFEEDHALAQQVFREHDHGAAGHGHGHTPHPHDHTHGHDHRHGH